MKINDSIGIILPVYDYQENILAKVAIFSKEEDEKDIKIFEKALQVLKTEKGFYNFISWFTKKPAAPFVERGTDWTFSQSLWSHIAGIICIKNLNKRLFSFLFIEQDEKGEKFYKTIFLNPGEWVLIKDNRIISRNDR